MSRKGKIIIVLTACMLSLGLVAVFLSFNGHSVKQGAKISASPGPYVQFKGLCYGGWELPASIEEKMKKFVVKDLENTIPDSPEAYGLSLADLEDTGKVLQIGKDASSPYYAGARVYLPKEGKGEFIMLELSSQLKDSGWVPLGLAKMNYKGKTYVLTVESADTAWPRTDNITLADLTPTGDRIYHGDGHDIYSEVYRSKDPLDESIYLGPVRGAEEFGGDNPFFTKWVTLEEALKRFGYSINANKETNGIVAWVNGDAVYENVTVIKNQISRCCTPRGAAPGESRIK